MSRKYFIAEQREAKILSYLNKHPLSTIREIADNYRTNKSSFGLVRDSVQKLHAEEKIEKIFNSKKKCYFLNPPKNQEKNVLIQIMKSKKIFNNRFKKISYDASFHYDRPSFPQIVEKCINLFYLKLKILLIEIRRKSEKGITKKQLKTLKKKFHNDFVKFLQDYSVDKYSVLGHFISVRGKKSFIEIKNLTQKHLFIFLSNYLDARYHWDKLYYDKLRSNSTSLKDMLALMSIWIITGNKRNAAESRGTTNKTIQRILKPIMGEDGGYSWIKAAMLQPAEERRKLMPPVSSADPLKVNWQAVVRTVPSLLKTPAGRREISARSLKKFGIDILKHVDWKSFDI